MAIKLKAKCGFCRPTILFFHILILFLKKVWYSKYLLSHSISGP